MCAPYVEARPKGGARAEKEIGEKAQKIIRHQIVSTYYIALRSKYCLQPSFGLIMCTFVLPLNTLKTCSYYMLCGYKKEMGEPSGFSGPRYFLAFYELQKPEVNLEFSLNFRPVSLNLTQTLSPDIFGLPSTVFCRVP